MKNDLQLALEKSSSRKLIVNIDLSCDHSIGVRSVEVMTKEYRNRTSFGEKVELDSVFLGPVATAIENCLNGVKRSDGVIALPDFILELPGLVLRGIHVMISSVTTTLSHVIIRFQQFLGGVSSIFRREIGLDDGLSGETDDLAVRTLSDIVVPMLNVCDAIQLGIVDDALLKPSLSRRFHDLSCEIVFQAELLKRFVAQRVQVAKGPDTVCDNLSDSFKFNPTRVLEGNVG